MPLNFTATVTGDLEGPCTFVLSDQLDRTFVVRFAHSWMSEPEVTIAGDGDQDTFVRKQSKWYHKLASGCFIEADYSYASDCKAVMEAITYKEY